MTDSPISFKSILPDSKDVRVSNINGVAHVWAVDLVFAMNGKTRGDAARLLREVSSANIITMSMPGKGNGRTKLVASDHVCSLTMAIHGIKSEKLKRDVCDILSSHFGGIERFSHVSSEDVLPSAAKAGPSELLTRGQQVCDLYERYKQSFGSDVATEVRQEYNKAMQEIFQYLNPSNPKRGYVYCFQSSRHADEVKIGFTNNVKRRLYEVNKQYKDNGNNIVFTYRYSVRSLNAPEDEKLAHAHFASVRLPGPGELFRTTPESVRDFFERYLDEGEDVEILTTRRLLEHLTLLNKIK